MSFAVLCMMAAFSAISHAQGLSEKQHVRLGVFTDKDVAVPGESFRIAVVQFIDDRWHTYWTNPGDSGLATQLKWEVPEGVEISDISWPVPSRIPYGPLMNFGYEGTPTTLQTVTLPDDLKGEYITLDLSAEWLVCKDICIPESQNYSLSIAIGSQAKSISRTVFDRADYLIPQKNSDIDVTYTPVDDQLFFTLKNLEDIDQIEAISFFPHEWGIIKNEISQEYSVTDDVVTLSVMHAGKDLDRAPIEGVIRIDRKGDHVQPLDVVVPYVAGLSNLAPVEPPVNNSIIIQAILFAFIGGLILNLMPCVFPVLSMKALSLIKTNHGGDKKHVRLHGMVYTAGVILSFLFIAGLLLILKESNQALAWGFQLQEPIFIGILTYLFFVISLNLAGYCDIKGGFFANLGGRLTQGNGTTSSFFTGVLAVLVATPCTAPFMASALGIALTQSTGVSLAIFTSLGFGLAFPYLALCFVPSLQKFLPRPGAWMDSFKQFLAFPIFATVAWLIWVYSQQTSMTGGFFLMLGIIFLGLAIWTYARKPSGGFGKTLRHVFGVVWIVLAFGVFAGDFLYSITPSNAPQTLSLNEKAYTPVALEDALRTDQPVFVEMTAAWCITCQFNKRIAIKTDATQKLIKDKNIIYILGDWTNQDSEITSYLSAFGRSGVPLYVYYGPPNENGERPEAYVLPQILTQKIVMEVFNNEIN